MNDLFKIISLIEVRIDDLDATSANQIAVGDPTRHALYKAQSRALRGLVWDLLAAMVPDRGPNSGHDLRSVLLVEMGGQTSATIINDADAAAMGARFEAEHANLLTDVGHAKWNIWPVDIPPLDPASRRSRSGQLDMRHALVVWMDSSLTATIHNTEADLDAAEAELRERYEWEIERREVTYHTHVILIPPRGAGHGAGPSGPYPPDRSQSQPTSTTRSERKQAGEDNMRNHPHLDGARRFTIKDRSEQDAEMKLYEDVAKRATVAMPQALASAIGPLAIAPRLHHDSHLTQPQFRSAPLETLAGAELRFHHLHDGGDEGYADSLLEWLLELAGQYDREPGRAADYVQTARAATVEAIDRDTTLHSPATLSAIGYLVGRGPGRLASDILIELEMLGPGLTPIVERIVATSGGDLPVKLAEELATHRRRVDLLAQFRANRQGGMIDETTLSIMRHVGMELEFALEHLTRTRELVFDFDEGAHRASMSWDEGALVTDFWTNDPGLSLMAGTLSLRQSYPDTIVIGSIGRRLGALIDHPLPSRDALITHACSDRSTIIELAVPRRPIPDL